MSYCPFTDKSCDICCMMYDTSISACLIRRALQVYTGTLRPPTFWGQYIEVIKEKEKQEERGRITCD